MLFAACFLLRAAPYRTGTMGGFWSALYVCHCFVCAFCRTAGLLFSRAWCLAVVTMKGCDNLASSQHGMCVCRSPPHWCVSLQTMGRATGLLVCLLACYSLVLCAFHHNGACLLLFLGRVLSVTHTISGLSVSKL